MCRAIKHPRGERDLITWLNQLDPRAESVYHDPCHPQQSSQLLDTAYALYTLLGNGENGQQWLCDQATAPSTLFGLALYNFTPELAALIDQVTHNFSTTGQLDDAAQQGDGSSSALNTRSPGDINNIASRSSELNEVCKLPSS